MSREFRDLEVKAKGGGLMRSSRKMQGKVRGEVNAIFRSNVFSQYASRGRTQRLLRASDYLQSRTGRHTFGSMGADAPSRVTPGGAGRSGGRAYR